ncbi:hypothetical protein J3A83DRAFT_3754723 [Scleroderma citrinum]
MTPTTEGKHKKPPTFSYLPKNRAKKLKKSWVDTKKLKNQWKAQKKREGLPSFHREAPSEAKDPVHTEAPQDNQPAGSSSTSKTSLRDLTRQAYSPSTLHTHGKRPGHPKDNQVDRPSRHPKGQPDMKLRMNAMLEKIKRDLC